MSGRLSKEDREIYRRLADLLLPACGKLPAASTVGVADQMIDRILEWRPDLAGDFLRGLAMSRGSAPEEAIAQLEADDPPAFQAIRFAALSGYYLDPSVREVFGYRGQESRPVPADEQPDYLTSGLLGPVAQRGPIWRRTCTQQKE